MTKRGLSPVVATALLITIAIILAAILFFWARGLLTERNQKFGEAIENACPSVTFKAEAFVDSSGTGEIAIVNRGNVPLYALDVRKENAEQGDVLFVKKFRSEDGRDVTVPQGSTAVLPIENSTLGIRSGDTLILQPVLLGSEGGEATPYPCTTQAIRLTVGSS